MSSIIKVDTIQNQSGANIISESANTITLGASGDTITVPSGATFDVSSATVAGTGITQADVWRYTASTAAPSGDITANWERADDASSGLIGTGMTQSSGIFSFPETGIYLITGSAGFNFANQQDNNANITINVTIDNSTYDQVSIIFSGSNSSANFSRFSQFGQALVDVTNTSLVKVKFAAASFEAGSYLEGYTDKNDTSFAFIRLGDT